MENHADQPDGDGRPADEVAEVAPGRPVAAPFARQQADEQHRRRGQREIERDVFGPASELVDRMGEVNIDAQKGQVNLAFLSVDIYLAHSVHQFRRWPEYIPLYL